MGHTAHARPLLLARLLGLKAFVHGLHPALNPQALPTHRLCLAQPSLVGTREGCEWLVSWALHWRLGLPWLRPVLPSGLQGLRAAPGGRRAWLLTTYEGSGASGDCEGLGGKHSPHAGSHGRHGRWDTSGDTDAPCRVGGSFGGGPMGPLKVLPSWHRTYPAPHLPRSPPGRCAEARRRRCLAGGPWPQGSGGETEAWRAGAAGGQGCGCNGQWGKQQRPHRPARTRAWEAGADRGPVALLEPNCPNSGPGIEEHLEEGLARPTLQLERVAGARGRSARPGQQPHAEPRGRQRELWGSLRSPGRQAPSLPGAQGPVPSHRGAPPPLTRRRDICPAEAWGVGAPGAHPPGRHSHTATGRRGMSVRGARKGRAPPPGSPPVGGDSLPGPKSV